MSEQKKKLNIFGTVLSSLSNLQLEQLAYDFHIITSWQKIKQESKGHSSTKNKGENNGKDISR